MNLLCHHATMRPTVQRIIKQIAQGRSKRVIDQYGNWSTIFERWECILGDLGRVSINRSAFSTGMFRSDETHEARICDKYIPLTCAELRAFKQAAYGHNRNKPA